LAFVDLSGNLCIDYPYRSADLNLIERMLKICEDNLTALPRRERRMEELESQVKNMSETLNSILDELKKK
jgi:hypothetical protein